MLALSTTLSMITPALALQEPSLPSEGASVFVDDVRVSAGDPATAKIHVTHDGIGVQTGKIKLDIPAATTGIKTADPLTASHDVMSVKAGDTLKTTGVGYLIWRSPDEYFTETDINLTVPNVSATTKIGLEVEQISGRAQGANANTRIPLDKVNAVSGSFIVQYPVTVKIADDSEKPKGAAIKVKTTDYNNNNKATFDKDGQTETDVYNGGKGGTFYVDSGAGQQNAPVLEFAVPENYYAEVTVGNTKKNTVATSNFTLSEITANTDVSVKLIAGKVPADTISTANITYKYGTYDLGRDTKQFNKKGTENAVAPKDFTAEGYTVYQYKLNDNAAANIGAAGTVDVDLTKDTNTVVFYYKRNDNSTVLPGPNGTMPDADDIIVKPTDSNTTLTPDGNGAVTFPEGGTGGTVSDKNGNSMVVPGGTKVDKNGDIHLPGTTDVVKPGDPNPVPVGWYQVTYMNGETKLFTQLGKTGSDVNALDWPSSVKKPAGKAFDGWNTLNSGAGDKYGVNDAISGAKTLYAQWTEDYGQNKITITFYPNLKENETADDVATQVIGNSVDTTFVANLNPSKTFTKEGWTLAGWNTQKDGAGSITYAVKGQIKRSKDDGDLNLYAQWIKTGDNSITVPGKDGIPGNTDDATANGSATQKPERKDDGTINVPNGGSVTEGDKEYPMPNGGTLKPNGDIIIKQPDNNGSIVVKPDGTTEVLKPNGDKDDTKTAFTVTYHSGEANVADKIVTAIGSAKVVSGEALFSYTDHKFAYWTKNTDDIIAVDTSLTENTELTAHWYKVGNNGEITVKPNPDEDKEIVVKPGTDGKKPEPGKDGTIDIPGGGEIEVKPAPDGGNGTITLPDGGKVNPDGTIVVPGGNGGNNETLDPSKPNTWPEGWFTVKYLPNDSAATGTMGEQLVKNSGTIMSCAFTNTGKTFVMWNTDVKGTGTAYTTTAPKNTITAPTDGTKSITLYAIWSIDNTNVPDSDGSITVPGKDGVLGGDPCDDVTITPNGKGDKPSWKEDKSGVIVPDGGSVKYPDGSAITPPNGSIVKPDGTIVLPDGKTIDPVDPAKPDDKPINKPIEGYVKITYLPNQYGSGTMPVQLVKKSESNTLRPVTFIAGAGKTFSGWNTDANGHGTAYAANATIQANTLTEDLTLYAQWVDAGAANTAKVIFHANNGTDTKDEQEIGSASAEIMGQLKKNKFTLTNWTFKGWTTQQDGNGTFYKDEAVITLVKDARQNLYAQWIKVDTDGTITVPGSDKKPDTKDDVIVKPNPNPGAGEDGKPGVDKDGNITIPGGGTVVTPDKEITLPGGGTLKQPDGTIVVPDKDGNGTITIDPTKPDVPEGMFTVTYKSGVAGQKDIVVYARTAVKVAQNTFTYEGHVFGYWTNANSIKVKVGTDLTATTVLTANWYEKNDKGEITIPGNPDGSTVIKPDPTDPTNPDKQPKVDEDGNVKVPEGGEVEKKPNGGTITLPEGGVVITPSGEIKVPDKNGNIVDPSNPGTLPTDYFQIVYNANGGKGEMEKQTGKTITVKANSFTHDTLTFAGWNTKQNGSGKGYAPNTAATVVDANAQTKTLTLYAIWVKKGDNGAITVPGKDGSIDPDTGKDNVTVKPNPDKPEEKPIQKPDGSIEIPGGGSGVIETPDKEPIVVPGGSVIKPDGTIEVPKPDGSDGKDNIDPSKPDQLPAGYFAVTYQSGKEPAEKDVMQIAKNGDKALSGAIFTAPAGKEFVNWKVQDADQSYNANESMNLTKNITLVAKWHNQGSGTTTYSAVVKYYNGKDTTPIKDEFTSDSDPMQRTLKNVFASEETNGWKLLGYNGNDGKFYQPTQSVSLKNHDVLELYAVWSKDGGNGTIVVPGPDGKPNTKDDITIKPNPDKLDEKPAVDGKGDVKVPDGGQITIPGKDNGEDTTVTVKPSATVKPDGTIVLPEGGTITVPGKDGKDTVITGPGNFNPDKITDPKFDPDNKPYKPGNGTVVLPGPDKKNGTDDDVIVTPTPPDKSVIDDKGQVTLPDGGKVNFPQQPAGNGAEVTVPNGTVITPDGVIKIPEGGTGSVTYPDGTKINPLPSGTEIKPDGSIKLPDGENGGATITKPDGSTIVVPGGTEIDKDGNITIPDGGNGSIKNPDGSEKDNIPGGATIDKDGRYRYLVSLKSTTGVALKAPNGYETTIWVKKGVKDVVVAPVIDNYTLTGESKFEVTGGQKVNDSYTITFTYKKSVAGGSIGGGGGGGGSVTSYVITASAGNGGTISPNGNVSVVRGSDKVFTITAKDGYRISNVIVDGESVGAVSTYTFRNVTTKHTIAASFIKVSEIPIIGPDDTGVDKWLRTDKHNSYITGYGNGLFGPENSVTRAQIAQIFYRLLKDQNVTATVNFSDVKPDAWYAEAVNALGSLGIISGVGKGKFDPDRAITRAEFCAVAARFAKVNSSTDCPFDDVNTRDWYYQAVATAASYGWVTGVSDGSFHPNNVISRAQAATIINRMLGAAADRDFVDSHVSNPYKDVSPSYWAYYQIIEASIPHNHSYNAENVEIWNGLK